jgi:opacity protein-like surface antigen
VWAQAGWYVTPSFSLTEEYDDNLFSAQSGTTKGDFITRYTPGVRAGYQSAPLTVLGSYSIDGEIFAKNTDHNNQLARHLAGLHVEYSPRPPVQLGLNATYTITQTPSELNQDTGIDVQRGNTGRRYAISPSAYYQFDSLTSGSANYSYTHSEASGVSTAAHRASLDLSRALSAKDSASAGYGLSYFDVSGVTSTSHFVTLGYTRSLTEHTVMSLKAGPRFTEGTINYQASANLSHEFKLAKTALAYSRSETTLIGRGGTVNVDAVTGTVSFEPLRNLVVNVAPSVRWVSRGEGAGDDISRTTTVYAIGAGASYLITSWLNAQANYRYSLQQSTGADVSHNIFSINLTAIYPIRVY